MPFTEKELAGPIPLRRPKNNARSSSGLTYGDYLAGVKEFILNNWDRFSRIVRDRHSLGREALSCLAIVAEKHGSDYHPARVLVQGVQPPVSFVVNVAMEARGKMRLMQDFRLLGELGRRHPRRFVPEVYFADTVSMGHQEHHSLQMSMFLGEWLEGFYEFHLSRDETDGSIVSVVWDTDRGYDVLTGEETESIYRQAACIMTYYYDLDAFKEIFPWHHAAGDFVVSRSGGLPRVRLITVRQYKPRTEFEEESDANGAYAVALFMANLTIRMRLDRLDGVGEVAWAPDPCVGATIRGFLDALDLKISDGLTDRRVVEEALALIKGLSLKDLSELFGHVAGSYEEAAPDVTIIGEHLVEHIIQVYRVLPSLL